MSELVEFLRARIGEDEQAARWRLEDDAQYGQSELDPDHALRVTGAMRRIIELHQEGVPNDLPLNQEPTADGILCMACTAVGEPPFYPCSTLRLLTLPYADHEDYRAEWAA